MKLTINQEYQPNSIHESALLINGSNKTGLPLSENQEYQIFLTQIPAHQTNGDSPKPYWWATLLGFPFIVETSDSRHQVLMQVKQRIADMLKNAEIVTVRASELDELGEVEPLPSSVSAMEEQHNVEEDDDIDHEQLRAMGWTHYGIFKDDPEALLLFDEIEEERNKHWVGGDV